MMGDVKPPQKLQKRPLGPVSRSQPQATNTPAQATDQLPPIEPLQSPKQPKQNKPKRSKKKVILWVVAGVVALLAISIAGAVFWYQQSLQAVAPGSSEIKQVIVEEGSSPSQIGDTLQENGLIRSSIAFDIYTRLSGTRSTLQAGTYHLSPADNLATIVDHLVAGRTEQLSLTFYPGATLTDTSDLPEDQKTDVQTVLKRAGYSDEEIKEAFSASYDSPLFATKPKDADIEGYVYGDTYNFENDATVKEVLERTFDEFYAVVTENKFEAAFKKHGLTLFQGITLASIIQREASDPDAQRQIAQVFYTRIAKEMPLGSDVTYQYAARILGVAPTPELDSPYNTRKFEGLPPGPIATPGLSALQAVADPAEGEYLYFLSGDDDKMYFSYTEEEHQVNIDAHCKIKCSVY